MSDLSELQHRAQEIKRRYDEINREEGRSQWNGKDFAMGFAGDFGDLQKLIMAKEGMRHIDDVDTKLEHELADCMWSIFVLADYYNVDLNQAFSKTMDELRERLSKGKK